MPALLPQTRKKPPLSPHPPTKKLKLPGRLTDTLEFDLVTKSGGRQLGVNIYKSHKYAQIYYKQYIIH